MSLGSISDGKTGEKSVSGHNADFDLDHFKNQQSLHKQFLSKMNKFAKRLTFFEIQETSVAQFSYPFSGRAQQRARVGSIKNEHFVKNRDLKDRLEGRYEMREKMLDAEFDPSQEPVSNYKSLKSFIPHSDLFCAKANRIAMEEAVQDKIGKDRE